MKYKFGNPALRSEAWTHAGEVLTIPEFLPLSYLVRHCHIIERILMNYEDSQKVDDHGIEEIVALADYWILGFFDILRIVMSKRYKDAAEFPVDQCFQELKKKTAFVRMAFTKLQPPGRNQSIVPSHSGLQAHSLCRLQWRGRRSRH